MVLSPPLSFALFSRSIQIPDAFVFDPEKWKKEEKRAEREEENGNITCMWCCRRMHSFVRKQTQHRRKCIENASVRLEMERKTIVAQDVCKTTTPIAHCGGTHVCTGTRINVAQSEAGVDIVIHDCSIPHWKSQFAFCTLYWLSILSMFSLLILWAYAPIYGSLGMRRAPTPSHKISAMECSDKATHARNQLFRDEYRSARMLRRGVVFHFL